MLNSYCVNISSRGFSTAFFSGSADRSEGSESSLISVGNSYDSLTFCSGLSSSSIFSARSVLFGTYKSDFYSLFGLGKKVIVDLDSSSPYLSAV